MPRLIECSKCSKEVVPKDLWPPVGCRFCVCRRCGKPLTEAEPKKMDATTGDFFHFFDCEPQKSPF